MSCFLNYIEDTAEGLVDNLSETNWLSMVDDTYDNMIDLKTRYNKDVMMVEVGFSNSKPDISHQFLTYMIEKTRQANGHGIFYWEPIARSPFTSYSKASFKLEHSSVTISAVPSSRFSFHF